MSSNDLWNTLAQGLLGFTISVLIVFIIEKLPLRLTAAWLAARRYYLAMELACDELAIRSAKLEHAAYAGLLVRLLEYQGRHPMPAHALSMARSGGFRTLSERIRFLKFDLYGHRYGRAISTLVTIATLGFVVLPWGFVGPKSLYAQSVDDFTPVKIDLETIDKPREISVVDSEGKSVQEFYYLPAHRYLTYRFDDLVNYPKNGELTGDGGKPLNIVRSENGKIQLPLPKDCDCVEIWNDRGAASVGLAQLRTLKSIQLQPWASLQIRPARNTKIQPAKNLFIARFPMLASGGSYKVTLLDDQSLEFPKCFPGEWYVYIGKFMRRFELRPGENKTIESYGRTVRGRIVAQDIDDQQDPHKLSDIKVGIKYDPSLAPQWFSIEPDGSFEIENVPFGKHQLYAIRESERRKLDYFEYPVEDVAFDCNEQENDEVLDLGLIPLKTTNSELLPGDSPNQSIAISGRTIDRVDEKRIGKHSFHQLLDANGQEMIVGAPIKKDLGYGLGSEGAQAAIDDKNSRVYLIGNRDRKPKTLYVYSIKGELIKEWESPQDPRKGERFYRMAINKDNGNLWLLNSESLGRSKVEILDSDFNSITKFPSDVLNMSYSEADKAMWTVSPTTVAKCDPDTGEQLASYTIPFKPIWTLTDVFPMPRGGVLCFERPHSDCHDSSNRLYRFDSDCQKVVCTDLGEKSYPIEVAVQEDIIWLKVQFYGASPRRESKGPRAPLVLGFDMQLNYLPDKKLAVEDFPVPRDSSRVGIFP
jgi:hypothetical protein